MVNSTIQKLKKNTAFPLAIKDFADIYL